MWLGISARAVFSLLCILVFFQCNSSAIKTNLKTTDFTFLIIYWELVSHACVYSVTGIFSNTFHLCITLLDILFHSVILLWVYRKPTQFLHAKVLQILMMASIPSILMRILNPNPEYVLKYQGVRFSIQLFVICTFHKHINFLPLSKQLIEYIKQDKSEPTSFLFWFGFFAFTEVTDKTS